MDSFLDPGFLYLVLQVCVLGTFLITALRAWKHSRARFEELITALMFGLVLEQGDIFLFGTYRYNENWLLLGDVPVAIALTWALVIAGAMNITDALGIPDASSMEHAELGARIKKSILRGNVLWLVRGLPAPVADAVWAILLDLALDAVAIRLGLWTWTIRADEGWFGVPWGNFYAWLFVAFWFSFFTRLVRTQAKHGPRYRLWQWGVPFFAFAGLIAVLVPFVALENTAALPFVADEGQTYRNEVWILFALLLLLFSTVTARSCMQKRVQRERADHWLLLIRLVIHGLFLVALFVSGIYLDLPILLAVAFLLFLVELAFTRAWLVEGVAHAQQVLKRNRVRVPAK